MSITFGNGIRLGTGISITPNAAVDLRYDPAYIGNYLGLDLDNTALYSGGPGSFLGITTQQMSSVGKYMATFVQTFNVDPYDAIGIANHNANLNNYIGSDTNSLGYEQTGQVWYNGNPIASGLSTWGLNDVIDVAVDNSNSTIWFRVNGGYWNNNSNADPATNNGGITIYGLSGQYFTVNINSQNGPSYISLQLQSVYNVPAGFTFCGPKPSFTITSADFTNFGWGTGVTPNSNLGFTVTNGSIGPGNACYNPNLSANSGGSLTKLNELRAYWAANGMNVNTNAYIFLVTWGEGSTLTSGLAMVELVDNGDNNSQLNMGTVSTNTNDWQTSGSNYYNGPPYTVIGTFNFPATFTVYQPLVVNNNNWC